MNELFLYRKRLIPDECIHLKDDIILHRDDDYIITRWKSIRPRKDMDHGFSLYLINEGIKVSKFYRADNSLLCWYCDIVDYSFNEDKTVLTTTDLLIDIVILPDGTLKVLDLDELSDAFRLSLIDAEQLHRALLRANDLLNKVYRSEFAAYQKRIESFETQ